MWTLVDARRWMTEGTEVFLNIATKLEGADSAGPSLLHGWSRKNVVAHVAANAEALGNLVHWAATGTPTPMYASAAERAAGIEHGSRLPTERLNEWLGHSARDLDDAMARLDETQWTAQVRSAHGRMIPASQIPWLRAREVWVHAADLDLGVDFGDLPTAFLMALADDVVNLRRDNKGPALTLDATDVPARWSLPGAAPPATVTGSIADIAAYLTGREHAVGTLTGEPAPTLPAWL